MGKRAEFVETSIAHQLGALSAFNMSATADAFAYAQRAASNMSLVWDHAAQAPMAANGWQKAQAGDAPWQVTNPTLKNEGKTVFAVRAALEAGADFDMLVDMQDHRARNMIMPSGAAAPVLSFNRRANKATGHVLWPLPQYHDLDSSEFLGGLDPDRVAWADKKDMAVWRGGPGNRGVLPGGRNPIRMLPLLQKHKSGLLTDEDVQRALLSMPRYRFVKNWIEDPRFDIGYTNSDGFILSQHPFLSALERPKLSRETFQDYKYIPVLPGSDVGSSFYWTMNSGSVGLVVDCDFETFASCHFKPWEHYVPVRRDQGNMRRIMGWCASNQDACQAIAKRAQEQCKYLADPDLRYQSLRGVIARMRQELTNNR